MGLDITAYSKLEPVLDHSSETCEDEEHIEAFAYDSFPQSFRGFSVVTTDSTARDSLLRGGCFTVAAETETHEFRAGSYGGYGRWRSDLREQFNPTENPDGPFYELIWFADNEGTIGPDSAQDLLDDFREHRSKYIESDDCNTRLYDDFMRACELAADGGLIQFY